MLQSTQRGANLSRYFALLWFGLTGWPRRRKDVASLPHKVPMLHMGRAWFPKSYPPSKRWAHTEGRSFSGYGQQVWCKCNFTASYIVPWPVPPDADWMSWVTLDTLHGALERFGPIPKNPRFRKLDKQDRPSWKGAISEHERHARGGKYHEGIP